MAQGLPPRFKIVEESTAPLPERFRPVTEPTAVPATDASLLRMPNVLAAGGLKGLANLVDLPLHVVQALIQLEALPFQGRGAVELPGVGGARQAVESYGQATGYQPPQTGGERVTERVGEELGGAVPVAAGAAGLANRLSPLLRDLLTSGKLRTDLLTAAGAGTGAGIAREVAPGNPTAELAGQVAGGVAPLTPALILRDLIGRGLLRSIGVQGLTPEQQAVKQSFANQGIDPLASDITGRTGVARVEAIPQQFPIGVQPAQQFAEKQLGQASQALERTVPGMTTTPPDPLGAGMAAQRDFSRVTGQRTAEDLAQTQAAQQAGTAFTSRLGATDLTTAGQLALQDVQAGYRQWQRAKGPFFEQVERMIGPEPVIQPEHLRSIASQIHTRSQATGLGGARGAGTLQDIGVSAPPDLSVGGVPISGMEGPIRDEILRQLGINLDEAAGPISFAQARQIQSRLGEMAYRRTTGPGTLNEGDARRMHRAISEDIDAFLTDPATDPRFGASLAEAKQHYATGKVLFSEGVNKQARAEGAQGETFLRHVFAPNQPEATIDFKLAVTPQAYQRAAASRLADLFDQATVASPRGRDFMPQTFVKLAEPYLQGGPGRAAIDTILEPAAATEFRSLVQTFQGISPSRVTDIEKLVTGARPEEIVGRVFRPTAISDTVAFKALADPPVFDQAVQTWAQQLYQDAVTTKGGQTAGEPVLSPSKFNRKVKPLVASGQLDVMFHDRPEVAGQLKELVSVFDRLGRAETLAGNPSGTGQALHSAGQYLTLGGAATGFLHGLATGNVGQMGTSLAAGAGALSPYALGKATRSPTGIRLLSEGIESPVSRYSGPAARFAARIMGAQDITEPE